MIEVNRVQPEARNIVLEAARVYVRHTRPWFVGLLIHGSALKGGFIPGCSDIDLTLYLEAPAFEADGGLPLNLGLSLHRDLAKLDPAPFAYIQCQTIPAPSEEDQKPRQLGPLPGAYHLLLGKLPVPEVTEEELIEDAHRALAAPDPLALPMVQQLLEHGSGRLDYELRRLCTRVWPTLYQVLVTRTDQPFQIWQLRKEEAVQRMSESELLGQQIRSFHRSVEAYYLTERTVERALSAIGFGVRFLRESREWYRRMVRP